MLAKIFMKWFPLAVIVAAMSMLGYILVQQSLRSSANDPQIQLSEDIADKLSAGQDPKMLEAQMQIDIAKSIAPYITVYNDKGEPIVSTATLDGAAPKPPAGVFEFVRQHHQDRVTWEPRANIREAVVVTRFESPKASGFVLAGRSLREVEVRESQAFSVAVLGGGTTAIALLFLVFVTVHIKMMMSQTTSTGKKKHAR